MNARADYQKAYQRARYRALRRLAQRHRGEYMDLLAEERGLKPNAEIVQAARREVLAAAVGGPGYRTPPTDRPERNPMTRIDITTRELHRLVAPVLPHASTDVELPQLNVVHLQVRRNVLYAVATDRYTMAATRLTVDDLIDDLDVTIDRDDMAAALKLYTFSKDDDPQLTLIVDKFPIPVGPTATLDGRGLRIDGEDGTRLILHDRGGPDVKPFARWQKTVGDVVHRATVPATPAVILTPSYLSRWTKAAGKGERLTVFVGPEQGDPILFTVEDHFVGIWKPATHIDGDVQALDDSPWRDELPAPPPSDDE